MACTSVPSVTSPLCPVAYAFTSVLAGWLDAPDVDAILLAAWLVVRTVGVGTEVAVRVVPAGTDVAFPVPGSVVWEFVTTAVLEPPTVLGLWYDKAAATVQLRACANATGEESPVWAPVSAAGTTGALVSAAWLADQPTVGVATRGYEAPTDLPCTGTAYLLRTALAASASTPAPSPTLLAPEWFINLAHVGAGVAPAALYAMWPSLVPWSLLWRVVRINTWLSTSDMPYFAEEAAFSMARAVFKALPGCVAVTAFTPYVPAVNGPGVSGKISLVFTTDVPRGFQLLLVVGDTLAVGWLWTATQPCTAGSHLCISGFRGGDARPPAASQGTLVNASFPFSLPASMPYVVVYDNRSQVPLAAAVSAAVETYPASAVDMGVISSRATLWPVYPSQVHSQTVEGFLAAGIYGPALAQAVHTAALERVVGPPGRVCVSKPALERVAGPPGRVCGSKPAPVCRGPPCSHPGAGGH